MKRILMTTALVAAIPAAVLAQAADETATDAPLMPQAEQSADINAEGDAMITEDGADVAADVDAETMIEEDADVAEGTDPMMPSADAETDMTAEGEMPMDDGLTMETEMAAAGDGTLGLMGEASANDIIGSEVYVIRGEGTEWTAEATFDSIEDGWERAGSVEDLVLSADGKVSGIVAEVGGFLGMGDKLIELELTEAKLVMGDDGEYDVVTHYTNDQLVEMQSYEQAALK